MAQLDPFSSVSWRLARHFLAAVTRVLVIVSAIKVRYEFHWVSFALVMDIWIDETKRLLILRSHISHPMRII